MKRRGRDIETISTPAGRMIDVREVAETALHGFEAERRGPCWPELRTNSFLNGEDAVNLRDVLAMIQAVGENTKRERFRFRHGLVA